MWDALILFVRKPELGKVKTRIGATEGDEAALVIYKKLLQHTQAITAPLTCEKYVFYAGDIVENDMWTGCQKMVQPDGDLGERMKYAFTTLFDLGYKNVCIIGSDCYQLTTTIIQEAFSHLQRQDVVIGPAHDGGYYLLAMKDGVKNVFQGIKWSTEIVLEQTVEKLTSQQYSFALLQSLHDVDVIDDVPPHWKEDLLTK